MNRSEDWITSVFQTGSGSETDTLKEELASVAGMLARLHGTSIDPATEPITTPDLTTLKDAHDEHA
jgi:hypothetical protein